MGQIKQFFLFAKLGYREFDQSIVDIRVKGHDNFMGLTVISSPEF